MIGRLVDNWIPTKWDKKKEKSNVDVVLAHAHENWNWEIRLC